MMQDFPISYPAVFDGLAQAILLFDSRDQLVLENPAARNLLGGDLKLIRSSGWPAAVALFSGRAAGAETVETARARSREKGQPARFRILRAGEYLPCWVNTLPGGLTLVTLEMIDWSLLDDLLRLFKDEMLQAADATMGHTRLIMQALKAPRAGDTVEQVGRRVGGFVQVIDTHMHRAQRLLALFERLERIRTGRLAEIVRQERRRLNLSHFVEDFLEELDRFPLLDPDTPQQDFRARITSAIPEDLYVDASAPRLIDVLHDVLRNAIMYSMKATPILIVAHVSPQTSTVQIDVTDEGYGVRAREFERVFSPFERARQPQIIGEFGYGLSLYLCKQEIEAMGGKIWFESEEHVGTTFSFKLPLWRDDQTQPSSSSLT